jgi:hypothetical protein
MDLRGQVQGKVVVRIQIRENGANGIVGRHWEGGRKRIDVVDVDDVESSRIRD